MKRVLALLSTAILVLVGGCGRKSYDARLAGTLDYLQHTALFDKKLTPALGSPISDLKITLRVPQGLGGPQGFQPTPAPPPGAYDLATSLLGQSLKLHVLARHKGAAPATSKDQPPAPRNKFADDVMTLLGTIYGANAPAPPLKPVKKGNNSFKFAQSNSKTLRVYIYEKGTGKDVDATALIWEAPDFTPVKESIDLCLEAFKMGS